MSSYDARLRLYVQPATCSRLRTKVLAARDNAEESFDYEGLTFHMDDRGSVYTEIGVYDKLPQALKKNKLRIRHCTIAAAYPATKTSLQPGTYGGRRELVGVHASVTQSDDAKVQIEVTGASYSNVIVFFDRLMEGCIKPNP